MILSSDGGAMNGADAAAGARSAAPPDFAASMSRTTIRPCGPEPDTRDRSILASLAMRLASGEANTRCPDGAAAGAGALGAAAGAAAAGFGASAGLASAFGAGFGAGPAAAAALTSSPSPASTAIT